MADIRMWPDTLKKDIRKKARQVLDSAMNGNAESVAMSRSKVIVIFKEKSEDEIAGFYLAGSSNDEAMHLSDWEKIS